MGQVVYNYRFARGFNLYVSTGCCTECSRFVHVFFGHRSAPNSPETLLQYLCCGIWLYALISQAFVQNQTSNWFECLQYRLHACETAKFYFTPFTAQVKITRLYEYDKTAKSSGEQNISVGKVCKSKKQPRELLTECFQLF